MNCVDILGVELELFRVGRWKKSVQPLSVTLWSHHPTHQRCFCQTRSRKVSEDRLGACSTVGIVTEEAKRRFVNGGFKRFVLNKVGVVEHKPHIQSSIRMKPHPNRIVQAVEIEHVLFRHPLCQRFKNRRGSLSVGIIPGLKFAIELQKPCIPIRLFEVCTLALEFSKKIELPINVWFLEMTRQFIPYRRRHGDCWICLNQRDHHPCRIHSRVPVKAAIKGTMLIIVVDDLWLALALPKVAGANHSRRMGVVFASKWIGRQRQPLNLVVGRGRWCWKTFEIVAYFRIVAALRQKRCRTGKTEAQYLI